MKRGIEWINHRIGYESMAKWLMECLHISVIHTHFKWLAILSCMFVLEVISGVLLGVFYVPLEPNAWSSVFYVQYGLESGWIIRGFHSFCGQALLWGFITYFVYIIFRCNKLIENELIYWSTLAVATSLLLLHTTGRLLPWDQTGFWSTCTVVDSFKNIPLVDFILKRFLSFTATDPSYALGRSFALHLFILPVSVLFFGGLLWLLIYRTSLRTSQTLNDKNSLSIFITFFLGLTMLAGILYIGRQEYILTDPAEISTKPNVIPPTTPNYWLQLFIPFYKESMGLFQLILFSLIIILVPFFAKGTIGKIIIRLGILCILLYGNILVFKGLWQNQNRPAYRSEIEKIQQHKNRALALAQSNRDWHRSGALALLQSDIKTQGPILFAQHCASCHRYDGHNGQGKKISDKPLASDLRGFASREWVSGILDPAQISEDKYFGSTPFKNGKMAKYIKLKVPKLKDDEKEKLKMGIWALSAEAALPYQQKMDLADSAEILKGQEYLKSPLGCSSCHRLRDSSPQGSAPDLVGYGSRQWLIDFISDPSQTRFYGDKNAGMPAFGESKILTRKQIEILTDWIREELKPETTQRNTP